MTAREPFARTWWGKQWIAAIERIDHDTNRLPRGRSYARAEKVASISIDRGMISAKVKGRRPSPYSITITLKRFTRPVIARVLRIINENPLIASELSLGKLPEALLDILHAENIHVLPESWNDIESRCSCPDWANPCKHLAAVYYLIGREIDKNPFILFNLRGVDTAEMSASRARRGKSERKASAIRWFRPRSKVAVRELRPVFNESLNFPGFDITSLLSLLSERPLFYPGGDFSRVLKNAYQRASLYASSVEMNEDVPHILRFSGFCVLFSGYTAHDLHVFVSPGEMAKRILPARAGRLSVMNIPAVNGSRISMEPRKGLVFSLPEIIAFFTALPLLADLTGASPSARFFSVLSHAAAAFVKSSSCIPEIVWSEGNEFSIRYTPHIHSEQHSRVRAALYEICPDAIGYHTGTGRVFSPDGVDELLSSCITAIMHRSLAGGAEFPGDKITSVFFEDAGVYVPERFEEQSTGMAVENWLERFSALREDVSPVIKVGEGGDGKFIMDIMIENKKDPVNPPVPLYELYGENKSVFSKPVETVRGGVARQIALAGEYLPELKDILATRGASSASIELKRVGDILGQYSPLFGFLGIRFLLPKALRDILKPTLRIAAKSPGTISYLTLDSMLSFSWKIAIGDMELSESEFRKLMAGAEGIVRYRDRYVMLEPEEIKSLLRRLDAAPRPSSYEALFAAMTGELNGVAFEADDALRGLVERLSAVEDVSLPEGVRAVLRPYQLRGFQWIYSNLKKGFGCCIADDMGLGKTVQVITALKKLKDEGLLAGRALVVCPTTLVSNWQREIERFAPDLRAIVYHGTQKTLTAAESDIVITTYGLVRRQNKRFAETPWDAIVIDEAQNIKNPLSDQSVSLKRLNARFRIAMSGTPVENRLTELWSIFDFVNGGYLGTLRNFKEDFALPIERYRDVPSIEKLKKVTAPFLLRRLKSDKTIISDLPDKIVTDNFCALTKEQAVLYEQVVSTAMREIEDSEGIERRGLIFQLITRLKQICNHPVHFSGKGEKSPLLSGKSQKAIELLEKILEYNEKTLIFTQYRKMGELLAVMIEQETGESARFFHGGLPRKARDGMVKDFQENPDERILIISLKAGGTGLNLTGATSVIHYDLWWNPAVENQATDRAYRIGQKSNVLVHRLITAGTFEEKIDAVIKKKQELADLTVEAGETWITEMTNRELKEIFRLDRRDV